MVKTKIIILVVLLILTVAGTSLWIVRHNFLPVDVKGVNYLKQTLGLSQTQFSEIEKLEENFCNEKENLCAQLCQKRFELSQEFLQPKINSEKMEGYIKTISGTQAELEEKTLKHLVEMDKVLEPEQKKKFFLMLADELCRNCKEGRCEAGGRCVIRQVKGGDRHGHDALHEK